MYPRDDLVQLALSNPTNLPQLILSDWDLLIRQGRKTAMLGRIYELLAECGLLHRIPSAPREHLKAAHVVALDQERAIRWEIYCIKRALAKVEPNFILLKGAAYTMSQLPFAQGRLQSDVDILVPKEKLNAVESALLANGWENMKLEKYDQRYYRKWSHELPPLYNVRRGTILDVHHSILPDTGRLHPKPEKLLERAESIKGEFRRLCPPDMVLHSAAHIFQDGDFHQGLREIADVDGLLRYFGDQPDFWTDLLKRAPDMDLHRPLFYAVRYSMRFLQTPIPDFVVQASQNWQPRLPVLQVMDGLVSSALLARRRATASFRRDAARWLLYVRSHWLRMPPLLLTRHLLHKGFKPRLSYQ
jgi:hypothetical protein